jgi:hypothetical protein
MTDIKAQLQQAHTLIKEKQFQQARRLLIGIDHPLAEEWLARIDTLVAQEADKARVKKMQAASSSPAVEADRAPRRAQKQVASPARPAKPKAREAPLTLEQTKERLVKAGELMKRQQYDEARAILVKLDHPKAAEWLARLDNLAPVDASGSTSTPRSASEQRAKFKRDALSMDAPMPENPPNAPFGMMPRNLRGAPFATFRLAGNWANLGKPVWGTLTSLGAVAILGGLVATMAFYGATFRNPVIAPGIMYGLMFTFIVAAYSFPYMIAWMQDGAYKHWQKGDLRSMMEHDYQLLPRMGGWMAIHAVVLVVLIFVGFGQTSPKTFSNDRLTITYPWTWENRDFTNTNFCKDLYPNQTCFLNLLRGSSVDITVMNDLDTGGFDLVRLDALIWDDLASSGYTMDGTPTSLTIDNHPAILRRYWLEDKQNYEFQLLILHGNNQQLLFVIGGARTKGIVEEYWHEVEKLFEGIDLHDNGVASQGQ